TDIDGVFAFKRQNVAKERFYSVVHCGPHPAGLACAFSQSSRFRHRTRHKFAPVSRHVCNLMQPATDHRGDSMSVRKKIVTTKGEEVTWWIADYSDGNGDRHQRRFPTKKEATAFIEPIKVAVRAGTHVSVPADVTIRDACDKWLKRCEANGLERGS